MTATQAATHGKGRWIGDWRPDDPAFWESTGKKVARRNLVFSILAEHLGFTLWTVWSIVAVKLGAYRFSTDQLFWIVSLPNLVGSALRIPYTFAPARFGGRNWTVISATLLLVPAVLLAVAVNDPGTPYWAFLLIAATAGLGGGNFASSMANITYFYPQNRQGAALGLNAAGGNIGVSSVQLLMPLVIAGFGLAAAGLFWVPFVLAAAAGAYFCMDNLTSAKAEPREMAKAAGGRRRGSCRSSTSARSARSSATRPRSRCSSSRSSPSTPRSPRWRSSARWSGRSSGRSAAGCRTASAAPR